MAYRDTRTSRHSINHSRRLHLALLAGSALTLPLLAPSPVQAQQVWDGSTDSNFGTADNWDTGVVPGATSRAVIASDTAALPMPLIGAGQEFELLAVTVGRGENGQLTIANGGQLRLGSPGTAGTLSIGETLSPFGVINSSQGIVNVTGGVLDVLGSMSIANGFGSLGTLNITAGGVARTAALCLGCGNPNFAGHGTVVIDGAGSRLELTTADGQRVIGNGGQDGGTAELTIRNGGRLVQTVASTFGMSVGDGSVLRVIGQNSELDLPAPLLVGGALSLEDRAVATIGHLELTGNMRLSGGAVLQQQEGNLANWSFAQQSTFQLTDAGTQMLVNGALAFDSSNPGQPAGNITIENGAVLRALSTSPSSLAFGQQRSLTIRNGAEVTLAGGLSMGNGTLNVQNASLAMSGPLDMGGSFAGNLVNLFNADFSATSITAGANAVQGASIINLGGTATGAAGEAGSFAVGQITLNGNGTQAAELVINHTGSRDMGSQLALGAGISGNGGILRHIAGDTVMSGTPTGGAFAGQTFLTGGSLIVDGSFGGAGHVMAVSGGSLLGGTGQIGGAVTLADATLAPGNSAGLLSFGGSLALGADSVLAFELGSPFGTAGIDSDLINVAGDLVLDGTLNISDITGAFGPGLYRLINYGGTLTNNGLDLGSLPDTTPRQDLTIQTSISNEINLIYEQPGSYTFWDGADSDGNFRINAGNGTWTASATNWTLSDGSENGAYRAEDFLIFTGPTFRPEQRLAADPSSTTGLVTVDDSFGVVNLSNGVQFAVGGYTIVGDDIMLDATIPCGECSPLPGSVIMRVGDGSNDGAAFTATIDARLVGEAGLTKTDLGTLILRGANTYSGGTIVSEGTLQGDSVSLQGNIEIATEGLLLFDQAINGTYAGEISGSGGIIKEGAGILAMTGQSSGFNGGTSLTAGTLLVDGFLGNGEHRFNASDGAILGGNGTMGGVATLSDAILAPGGTLGGSSVGHLTFEGNLSLNTESILSFELGNPNGVAGVASDLVTVGRHLALNGTLNIIDAGGFGSGIYRLFNYGGDLFGNGLVIGDTPEGVLASDLTIQTSISNQVNLLFNGSGNPGTPDSFTFWDGSDTSGNFRIDAGNGTWTASASNWTTVDGDANGAYDPDDFLIFAGPTQNQQTRLAVAPSANAGLVTIDDAAGAVTLANGVQFAVSGYTVTGDALGLTAPGVVMRVGDGTAVGPDFTATIAAPITGSGGIDKTDLGTLILTGANSYSGGTRVSGGMLQGNATSLQGAIEIATPGTLLFDQAANGSYAGTLSGSGALHKEGAGILALTGNSAGFGGNALLTAGGLSLTGTLGSASGGALRTAAGTTLIGNGTLGNLDLAGSIAPGAGTAGSGIGQLRVAGDLIVRAGASFLVDVAANGANDRIQVGGSALLEGGTVVVTTLDPQTSYRDGTVYRILDAAGGRTGTFAGLSESSAFLDFTLGYDPTGAFLTTSVIAQFPDVALTFNQRQASLGLQDLGQTAGSDSLAVYNALLMLNADQARAAFDLSSGEIYADIAAAGQRAAKQRGAAALRRGLEPGRAGWQAWTGGTITRARVSGDGNGGRFTSHGEALELGVDYHDTDDRLALGISGGWTSHDVTNAARQSRADLDGWFLSGFARYGNFGPGLTLGMAASFADSDGDASRSINFGSISRSTRAHVNHRATAATAELRYGFGPDSTGGGGWAFGPSLAIDHATSRVGGFAESGADALNLSSNGISDASTRYGAGAFTSWRSTNARLLIDVRYARDSDDDLASQMRLAGSPRSFTILPARQGSDGVQLAGAGSVDLGNNLSIGAQGSAFLVDGANDLSASAWLRWKF